MRALPAVLLAFNPDTDLPQYLLEGFKGELIISKFLMGGAAAAALVAGSVAFAQPAPQPGQPSPRAGKMMKTETRANVQAHVQRMFARLDANHDGFITKDEVDAAQSQFAAKLQKRADRFDGAKIFDRLDVNHDGKITQAEAEAAHSQRVAAKGGQPATAHATAFRGLFARADTNKDGIITRAEFDAAAAQMHARMEKAGMHRGLGGRMFEMADVNKDGRVSLAEAQQVALQHFDRADLNHDGQLTPQERQQSREQLRAQRRPS
jgi:Ca2+-binding EF-hand superfamily protein